MNFYAIGIGGTGAKCMEALIHSCAAGLMPKGRLSCLYIDPDRSNGSVGRSMVSLNKYIECKKLSLGNIELFNNKLEILKPGLWSPIATHIRPTLSNFFRYDTMKSERPEAAHLMDVLYSNKEKETTLEQGFRGYPSIGAGIMSMAINDKSEPWRTFAQKIVQDLKAGDGARVFLFGSIFGGTGASGLPTIARKIKNTVMEELGRANAQSMVSEKIQVGAAMVLPYFSFVFLEKEDELKAKSENFLLNTQVALKYYHQMDSLKIYDTVYLFGDETQSPVSKASLGGKTQENEPHFIELYAALSAIDFFNGQDHIGYLMVARANNKVIDWQDLPDKRGTSIIKNKIGQMTRFAFAYLSTYFPMIEDIKEKGNPCQAPWFIDLFERENIKLSKEEVYQSLLDIKDYCETYLKWISSIHESVKDESINLIKYDAFTHMQDEEEVKRGDLLRDFKFTEFNNLVYPFAHRSRNGLGQLWDKMSDISASDFKGEQVDGIGKFINALYKKCSVKQ
ncbi:MAG: hypothetical protein HQK92_02400 [Nitrospirae bacterium]|nr:hypothetical protein [Nitrospirota bacterium]